MSHIVAVAVAQLRRTVVRTWVALFGNETIAVNAVCRIEAKTPICTDEQSLHASRDYVNPLGVRNCKAGHLYPNYIEYNSLEWFFV